MDIIHRLGKYEIDCTKDLILTKTTDGDKNLANITIKGLNTIPLKTFTERFKASFKALFFIWFTRK